MKYYFLTLFGILLTVQTLIAQNEQVSLLVQSPDGKNVKIAWFIKKWNSDITGFDVKRKEGLQDWVKLNKEPILPGISMKKNLSATGVDKNEENKLKARLFKLLASRKLKETEISALLQKLSTDEKALKNMMDMMARDNEIALMNGFAFTDHTITNKTDYQYGLFIQGTDKLLARTSWNYGEIPDLNMVTEITSKATTKSKGVQIIWNADLSKMKAGYVAGFNIYRQGIRLNNDPVLSVNYKDASEFTWNDKSANSNTPIQYSIGAESIFGIEGIIRSYTYDPADHPAEYKLSEVTEVNSNGYYFKEGISVKWAFPKEYERFIKGLYVEKDNLPAGYKRVSELLGPSVRSFIDKTPSPVTAYVRFRIVALYNDKTQSPGREMIYSYFPVNEPPPPQNVAAKNIVDNKSNSINLTWDPKITGDGVTDNYKVYVWAPAEEKFRLVNEDRPVKGTSYVYNIHNGNTGLYKFFVSSASKAGAESSSDTISLQVSGFQLPVPVITKLSLDSNKAIVQWKYADIPDLKGFRLYRNKIMIAGESILKKNARDFIPADMEAGNTYEFTVTAVSESGTVSEPSSPASLIVPALK